MKPTPPTPVQSYQDLSVLSTSPPPSLPPPSSSLHAPSQQHRTAEPSDTDTGTLHVSTSTLTGSGSAGSLQSGNTGSELELKQSVLSPVHSKRSLSADTRKSIAAQLADEGSGSKRVVSAGDSRKGHSKDEKGREEVRRGKKDGTGKPPREPRKSSADLPFWNSEVVPLLSTLESTPYQEAGQLSKACSSLWACLERRGLLGRTGGVGGTKKRGVVLRAVFKLLDHKEPRLLIKVAKIIIAVSLCAGWGYVET